MSEEKGIVKIDVSEDILSNIVLKGDLSGLTQIQLMQYYNAFCQRVGLDPVTRPFLILSINSKKVLYCDRSGTQQLNKLHHISHAITNREIVNGAYVVTCRASGPDGRFTDSIGAVPLEGLKGEAYTNALMKAETKAKRRATLDFTGLGMLDESEVDSIQGAKVEQPEPVAITQQRLTEEVLSCLLTDMEKAQNEEELKNAYKLAYKAANDINDNESIKKISNKKDELKAKFQGQK